MKETGARSGEALRLTPTDFDLEKQVVTINRPEKRSRPRQFKMSTRLTAMMAKQIHVVEFKERIWKSKPESIRRNFLRRRKRLAERLGDPNINRITLHTFRHFKATMEYHRTKDILYVQQILGHRSLKNTLIYTHLVEWEDDEWTVKVSETLEEAVQLLEAGFEYVTDYQDKKLFRKRK